MDVQSTTRDATTGTHKDLRTAEMTVEGKPAETHLPQGKLPEIGMIEDLMTGVPQTIGMKGTKHLLYIHVINRRPVMSLKYLGLLLTPVSVINNGPLKNLINI